MIKHLAIFTKPAITQIFSGQKTIESRFSKKRIAPFGQISAGDTVFMKLSGKDICGQFTVKKVLSFDNLDREDWQLIKTNFWPQISLGEESLDKTFLKDHQTAKFATLIYIEQVEQLITSPFTYRKSDRRGWVVLDNLKNDR